jgi:hypothetical protein
MMEETGKSLMPSVDRILVLNEYVATYNANAAAACGGVVNMSLSAF